MSAATPAPEAAAAPAPAPAPASTTDNATPAAPAPELKRQREGEEAPPAIAKKNPAPADPAQADPAPDGKRAKTGSAFSAAFSSSKRPVFGGTSSFGGFAGGASKTVRAVFNEPGDLGIRWRTARLATAALRRVAALLAAAHLCCLSWLTRRRTGS